MASTNTGKEDHRVRVTKQILHEALLDLLETATIDKVSVSKLCETAKISRNTFYAHYNTPDDVLNELHTEYIGQFLSVGDIEGLSDYEKTLRTFQITLENKRYAQILMRNRHLCKIQGRMLAKQLFDWSPTPTDADSPADNYLHFLSVATMECGEAILSDWVTRGMIEPPELVAAAVTETSDHMNALLKRAASKKGRA